MKNVNEQRIDEYNEHIELMKEGVKVYEQEVDSGVITRGSKVYELKEKVFNLKLKLKSTTAAVLQLGELMNKQDEQNKKDIKDMKENWPSVLKAGMDAKERFPKDEKRAVMGIKDTAFRKAFTDDMHKLTAFRMLKGIMQKHSNGKSI